MADEWIMYGVERDDPECIYISNQDLSIRRYRGLFIFQL